MAEPKLSDLVAEEVDASIELVKQYVKYFTEELWPSLVSLKPPAERLDWYHQIDWGTLRDTSEFFWALMTADADRLMKAEEQRIAAATDAYEKQAFTQAHAFRSEQQPLSMRPSHEAEQAFNVGQGVPVQEGSALPLGRFA